jgi:hypothetical protein
LSYAPDGKKVLRTASAMPGEVFRPLTTLLESGGWASGDIAGLAEPSSEDVMGALGRYRMFSDSELTEFRNEWLTG